jgi:hypothetical protein
MRNLNHSFHECEGELIGDKMLMLIADLDENHIMTHTSVLLHTLILILNFL